MAINEKPIGESKPYIVWTVFALIVILAMAYFLNGLNGKNRVKSPIPVSVETPVPSVTITQVSPTLPMQKVDEVTELKITDIKEGSGPEAVNGKTLTVNYRGALADGTQFDSSYERGDPFVFRLGSGRVIQGWEKGILGMKVGGKRKLVIPPDLGYGEGGTPDGSIPPNSTLVFEVELLGAD